LERIKLRGWNVKPTLLSAGKDAAPIVRRVFSECGRVDHQRLASGYQRLHDRLLSQHERIAAAALKKHGDQGPLVSGVVRGHFPAATKEKLRTAAHTASKAGDAAVAHYYASGGRKPFWQWRDERKKGR